jgi:hypothetical protein
MITRMTIMTSFPEVFSPYARQAALEVLGIDFVQQQCAATTPYGTGYL